MNYKLSISNIAWNEANDQEIFKYMKSFGFSGLEIAPTRIINENPYSRLSDAEKFSCNLKAIYGLTVSSIQSIWFGKCENIFVPNEAESLVEYTKLAVNFAEAMNCRNIVFGCPKNRIIPDDKTETDSEFFFNTIATYASQHETCIALEPNPVIYDTNFINYTLQAVNFVKHLNNPGLRVNVDLGTIIVNDENLGILEDNMALINHIHISEPYLEVIKKRELHGDLRYILEKGNYNKYVSIEMKNNHDIETVKDTIKYISEVFL